MKTLILLAGSVMLAATPAVAKDQGQGNGKHGKQANHGKSGKAHKGGHSGRTVIATDRLGRVYAFNAQGGCPPGLAKKNNGCLPPGQTKKLYNVGQTYDRAYGSTWTYDQIPVQLRTQYSLNQTNRYYYNSGYLYQVDPQTMLIQRVISALLR